MKFLCILLLTTALAGQGCAQPQQTDRVIDSPCEDCELLYNGIPSVLSWETKIGTPDEPGEPIIVSGVIRKKDGTPAADVILYVYHTDNKGYYSNPNGKGVRHGHLRGWMKTDAAGRYQFKTIRPSPYPNGDNPAHIHPLIKEPGLGVYWIDEFLFDDDPLVTAKVRSSQHKRGGGGIIHLTKKDNGVWYGQRDITLGMNVPNY